MKVRFELSSRLAHLAGFATLDADVSDGATLGDALATFARALPEGNPHGLLPGGRLHSSVLIVVDGTATRDPRTALTPASLIQVLVPIAGG